MLDFQLSWRYQRYSVSTINFGTRAMTFVFPCCVLLSHFVHVRASVQMVTEFSGLCAVLLVLPLGGVKFFALLCVSSVVLLT